MATQGMMSEMARRQAWVDAVNEYLRQIGPVPNVRAIWPELQDYYFEGGSTRQVAVKYLERRHLGVNT